MNRESIPYGSQLYVGDTELTILALDSPFLYKQCRPSRSESFYTFIPNSLQRAAGGTATRIRNAVHGLVLSNSPGTDPEIKLVTSLSLALTGRRRLCKLVIA